MGPPNDRRPLGERPHSCRRALMVRIRLLSPCCASVSRSRAALLKPLPSRAEEPRRRAGPDARHTTPRPSRSGRRRPTARRSGARPSSTSPSARGSWTTRSSFRGDRYVYGGSSPRHGLRLLRLRPLRLRPLRRLAAPLELRAVRPSAAASAVGRSGRATSSSSTASGTSACTSATAASSTRRTPAPASASRRSPAGTARASSARRRLRSA